MKPLFLFCTWLATTALAEAHVHVYQAYLAGTNEVVPNGSLGIGTSTVTLDLDFITLQVEVNFSGLTGTTTQAYLHGPSATAGTGAAGIMSPPLGTSGFPLGVTSGTYDHTFDITVASGYDPGFITASGGTVSDALNALAFAFEDGKVYLSLKSSAFPAGEIRGFFVEVPEPTAPLMLALALAGGVVRRRRMSVC